MEDGDRFIGYLWDEAEPMFSGFRLLVRRTHPPRFDPSNIVLWRVVRVQERGDSVEVVLVPDTDRLRHASSGGTNGQTQ
ncbi:MAG: hypothetical protein ACREJQ_06325 [bacterium]